jgi:voltage-gated potassium channel
MTRREWVARVLEENPKYERQGRLVNIALIGLIALNVIAIILESEPEFHQKYHIQFWNFELFSVIVFTVEYLIRVWCSIDLEETHDSSPIRGRIKYMLSPMAVIDLVAIVPFFFSLYVTIDLRFLRVLRMLRLFKLTRYSSAMGALLDVIQKESAALIAAVVILFMMLIFSASGVYLLENEVQPESFGSIPDAMWWSIMTLTTVGYGDVVPVTPLGKFFGGLVGLIGVGMVALPAAIMASGFAENLNQRRLKYNSYIKGALNDGIIDDHERWELEKLRKDLGLESEEAIHLLDSTMREARRRQQEICPHCGKTFRPKSRGDHRN